MKVRKKKLEPHFGDVMDVYYILDVNGMNQRVLMGRMPFNGKDPCQGTFQIEPDFFSGKRATNLILSSKDKDKHVRIVYYAQTVYQLDTQSGATKIPLKVDRR